MADHPALELCPIALAWTLRVYSDQKRCNDDETIQKATEADHLKSKQNVIIASDVTCDAGVL